MDEKTPQPDTSHVSIEAEFEAAVSPKNLKGRITCRTDDMMLKELEDIAESSLYPLNSVSEVVRFCCMAGLERIREWKPAPTLLGAIKAANQIISKDKLQCEANDIVTRLSDRVEWYIQNGFYDEAIDLVAKVRTSFAGTESNFWAEQIINQIDLKFVEWCARISLLRKG